MRCLIVFVLSQLWLLSACNRATLEPTVTPTARATAPSAAPATATNTPVAAPETAVNVADVTAVTVSGSAGSYTFAVEIESPDLGCEQYADWWEVLSTDGELLYRRVLLHSHVNEQPFIRAGGPVEIEADTPIWVRAHMHPGGYGGKAWQGSVASGFTPAALAADFAAELAQADPLPQNCIF